MSVDRSSIDQIKCGKNTIKKGRKCVSSTKCGPGTKNVNNLCLPIVVQLNVAKILQM